MLLLWPCCFALGVDQARIRNHLSHHASGYHNNKLVLNWSMVFKAHNEKEMNILFLVLYYFRQVLHIFHPVGLNPTSRVKCMALLNEVLHSLIYRSHLFGKKKFIEESIGKKKFPQPEEEKK